jgi:hypothetical protein
MRGCLLFLVAAVVGRLVAADWPLDCRLVRAAMLRAAAAGRLVLSYICCGVWSFGYTGYSGGFFFLWYYFSFLFKSLCAIGLVPLFFSQIKVFIGCVRRLKY